MKNLNIIVLIAALVAIGLGLLLGSDDRQTEIASDLVFPELQASIDEIDTVRIENSDGLLLNAQIIDGVWGASDKGGYPLEAENIIKLLNALVQAKLDSAKTAKAENHARLGLQDLDAEDAQSRLLEVKAGQKSWSLLLGNNASAGNGLFVRKPDEDQTWLTRAQLDLPLAGSEWLKQQILDIADDTFVKVERKGHWTISKRSDEAQGTSEWLLDNIPEGRELNYDSIVANKVEDIFELSLDDLAQAKPMDFSGATLKSEFELTKDTDETITIQLYKSGDDNLVVYESASVDSHWNKWVYKVSDFNAGKLTKDLESFLMDLPEEPAANNVESD